MMQFRKFAREECGEAYRIPEITDGFDPDLEASWKGMYPVTFLTDETDGGNYVIHIRIRALEDIGTLFLFTGRKLLRDIISLKKGEVYERRFYQAVSEIIPRYHAEIYREKHLFVSFCTNSPQNVKIEECTAEKCGHVKTIYLCGDSTVTDQASEIPYHPGACYASWGQALPAYLDGKCVIQNQAHCGLTTETFLTEGHFSIVEKHILPGDLCVFQFGHNDQKLEHLQAGREYIENLRCYVHKIREKEAIPVLVTPLGRNIWKSDGKYYDLLDEHAEAVKKVAKEMDVSLIDLHQASVEFMSHFGQKRTRDYFHPDDYTHTNEYGAYLGAGYIAGKLEEHLSEEASFRKNMPEFYPPENLWGRLDCENNRKVTDDEREIFDRMEKSVSDLIWQIETVKSRSKQVQKES